jgi:hypothetical protein
MRLITPTLENVFNRFDGAIWNVDEIPQEDGTTRNLLKARPLRWWLDGERGIESISIIDGWDREMPYPFDSEQIVEVDGLYFYATDANGTRHKFQAFGPVTVA